MTAAKGKTTEPTGDLTLQLEGFNRPIRMRYLLSKGLNGYWAVVLPGKDKSSPFGVQFPAQAEELPKVATILDPSKPKDKGLTINLVEGLTGALDDQGRAKEQRPKRHCTGVVYPLPNGVDRKVTIQVSITKAGDWNVIGKAIGISEGGGAKALTGDALEAMFV